MQFDGTINLGHVITTIAFISTLIGGWYGLRGRMDVFTMRLQHLDERTNGIATEMKQQTEILVRLGRYETELDSIREQLRALHTSRRTTHSHDLSA